MGSIISRIPIPFWCRKNPDVYRKELEDINKRIFELERSRLSLYHKHQVVLELIVTYSRLLYVLVALVFFFSTLPSSLFEYILFCGPLLIFHLLVYALKAAVKWYFEDEINRNIDRLRTLKSKKKALLSKVQETTLFKEAKDILEKYTPEKRVDMSDQKPLDLPLTPKYLDNVVSYVLGEQKENSLICVHCQWHNGMALEEERDYIGFWCCRCFKMNQPRMERSPKEES